ncbi:hypothetical protein BZG02_00995 [Labilibaculum filiforme]|uniref:DNA-binding response regulator n=1 Tax=Labilibaculum filiforme TaxID=1940526 RepID=A0A2N3I5M9_9BACT|nr:LytTR family DNA-binding domain-containing protein [Labilibaculum filiforme]PKQ65612.1 hypothetical protein BZG02_00995 [Labilibaculum filiforme]
MNKSNENTFTCLIVEDEPLSQEILESYINDSPQLLLKGICSDAIMANSILMEEKIELVFLDINMPKMNGIEWVKSLREVPEIIFTTAYPEYAVDGFELNALDYLLKPFSLDRFFKAVNKFMSLQKNLEKSALFLNANISVKSNKKTYLLKTTDLKYIESEGDYLKLHRDEDCLVIHETLKSFQTKLPEKSFLRIHRSFIINLNKVEYFEGNQVCIGNQIIPVASSYRKELIDLLDKSS